MFGWTLVRKSELQHLKRADIVFQSVITCHRWLAGWRDLDIIWDYILSERTFGGISGMRTEYAKARGTNEYGSSLESLARLDKTIKEQLARANEAAERANVQPRRQDGESES